MPTRADLQVEVDRLTEELAKLQKDPRIGTLRIANNDHGSPICYTGPGGDDLYDVLIYQDSVGRVVGVMVSEGTETVAQAGFLPVSVIAEEVEWITR